MGEEFGVEVCSGGNWYNNWNSSINLFASSPCSSAINDTITAGNFGIWPSHHLPHDPNLFINNTTTTTNTRSSSDDDSAGSASVPNGLTNIVMTSSLHDWTTTDINQNHLIHTDNAGRSQENYSHLLQQTGLDTTTFSEDSSSMVMNSYKQVINDQAGLSNGYPLINSDDSYSLYTSSLLQTLFDTDSNNDQQEITNYNSSDIFNSLNEILPTKANSPMMINSSSSSLAKQHHDDFNSNRVFVSSTKSKSHFLPSSFNTTKPNRPNFTTKHHSHEEVGDKNSVATKTSSEPAIKRARIETPSPLPTFKVRKEKLGDRITALQQLVSPFGKTDTASVLQEAIEYIKFLHDQASALSSPYFKNGPPPLVKRQQTTNDKMKEQEGLNKDLKSRGLCLVPISSTFPVATETSSDFWTPTFGGTFN